MSIEFGIDRLNNRKDSNLKGDCIEYLDRISPKDFAAIGEKRIAYLREYKGYNEYLQTIAESNRIKHRKAEFKLIADRAKAFFNYRSLDYYLFRLGIDPLYPDTAKLGAEYDLYTIYENTRSLLITLQQYSGYNFTHWYLGCGHNDWIAAGEPKERSEYLREDLGIIL